MIIGEKRRKQAILKVRKMPVSGNGLLKIQVTN